VATIAPLNLHIIVPTTAQAWGAEMVRGICDEAAAHPHWRLRLWPEVPLRGTTLLRTWRQDPGDAALVFPQPGIIGGCLQRLGVPTVALAVADGPLPVVKPDDAAIGAAAARHLMVPGWTPVAVSATRGGWWDERGAGWRSVLPQAQVVQLAGYEPRAATAWLRTLPPASALFAAHDRLSAFLAACAPEAGRTVGGDLRILGVDDDLVCRMSSPALSSVRVPWRAIGRLGAATVAAMIGGQPVPARQELPPLGLAVRGSTDPLATAEPWLQEVAARLRRAAAEGQDQRLDQLIAGCGRSRSAVERAWLAATGQSLLTALHLARCERAVELLARGHRDLDAVARAAGLNDATALRRVLRRRMGITPGLVQRLG
jgi:LacI family transcriptional regulator